MRLKEDNGSNRNALSKDLRAAFGPGYQIALAPDRVIKSVRSVQTARINRR